MSYLEQQSSQNVSLNHDTRFVSIINDMIERIAEPEASACCAGWVTEKMPAGYNTQLLLFLQF